MRRAKSFETHFSGMLLIFYDVVISVCKTAFQELSKLKNQSPNFTQVVKILKNWLSWIMIAYFHVFRRVEHKCDLQKSL